LFQLQKIKIPQQVIRLAILFSILIAALLIARYTFIPKTFGKYGHYRAAAVDEIKSLEINYAGAAACIDCHDDIYMLKSQSNHRGVSCEVCHGPLAKHIEAPDEFKPEAPRHRDFCPICHGYNPSRPTGFPQIIAALHNPGKACMSCHNPHNPVIPHAPDDCSACHRQIASQKMVSHHASLDCTTCHAVPSDHWINPRLIRAQKPLNREFCGQCHDTNADSPAEIPRINIDTHGERYLCWDCHYPHNPEAN
jgi:hypothetical protein